MINDSTAAPLVRKHVHASSRQVFNCDEINGESIHLRECLSAVFCMAINVNSYGY